MQSWIVPFVYAALVLGLYLLFPEQKRPMIQKRIRHEINYYIIADLILIALAIVSTLAYRQHWLKWLTWGALVIATYLAVRKTLTPDRRTDGNDGEFST